MAKPRKAKCRLRKIPGTEEYELAIYVGNIKVRPNPKRTRYFLVDIEENIADSIVASARGFYPKLILKLYCKVPPQTARLILEEEALERFRANSPMII